ncbi:MAG: VCBS repeat-containing protein, partial [Candidatus Cloacimonetes bacterium]|nr:VCBS repeat-containing protein [Candidatus Cloacimonadota bacterium]
MDYDGDNDIVGLTQIFDIIGLSIYENVEENNFYEHEQTFYEIFTSSFVISDLDNDDFPDIVCPDLSPDGGIYIIYNEGDFNLSEQQYFYVANYGEPIRKSFCADLDGNGFNDIITIRYSHNILPSNLNILFNDGNGNFVENPQVGVEQQYQPIS